MGDFYSNLNKGIDNIVPLALKKFELDQADARWQAENAMKQEEFGMRKQKFLQEVDDQRRMREFGDMVRADMGSLEALKSRLPAIESNISQAQVGAGPDVDPEEMMTRLRGAEGEKTALMPQIATAQQRLSPERLIMNLAAAHPEKGMQGIMELAKEKSGSERLIEKINNSLQMQGMKTDMAEKFNDAKMQFLYSQLAAKQAAGDKADKLSDADKVRARILSDRVKQGEKELLLLKSTLGEKPYWDYGDKWKAKSDRVKALESELMDAEDQMEKILEGGGSLKKGVKPAGSPAKTGGYTWDGTKLVPNK